MPLCQFMDHVFVVSSVMDVVSLATISGAKNGVLFTKAWQRTVARALARHNDNGFVVTRCCLYFRNVFGTHDQLGAVPETDLLPLLLSTMAAHAGRPVVVTYVVAAAATVCDHFDDDQWLQAGELCIALFRMHAQVPALHTQLTRILHNGAQGAVRGSVCSSVCRRCVVGVSPVDVGVSPVCCWCVAGVSLACRGVSLMCRLCVTCVVSLVCRWCVVGESCRRM